jgi:hypothetical protein
LNRSFLFGGKILIGSVRKKVKKQPWPWDRTKVLPKFLRSFFRRVEKRSEKRRSVKMQKRKNSMDQETKGTIFCFSLNKP